MMPDLPVRLATAEDENEIMRLCAMLYAENGQHKINLDKVHRRVLQCIDGRDGILVVIGDHGNIFGMLCLLVDEVWYSDEFHILELFNYVRPDARRSNYAKKLITYAKGCADGIGLDLMIGVLSDVQMEAKVRLYNRLLPKGGEFFVYHPASRAAMHEAAE